MLEAEGKRCSCESHSVLDWSFEIFYRHAAFVIFVLFLLLRVAEFQTGPSEAL
jgi:hypothetical protein